MALTKILSSSVANIASTILNDISSQFDGVKSVFPLVLEQTSINTIVDSKDLEVVVNGQRLVPYVTTYTYPWINPYDSFKGFKVSGSNLIIYNAPYTGDSVFLKLTPVSVTKQTRRYPFTATTIALGD